MAEFYKDKGNHVITCVTEHKAVLDSCKALERAGKAEVTYLPVDQYGMVSPDDVAGAITDNTVLISIMGRQQRNRQPCIRCGRSAGLPRTGACCFTVTRPRG